MYLCYVHDTIPLGQVADLVIDIGEIEQMHWACMHSDDGLQALG